MYILGSHVVGYESIVNHYFLPIVSGKLFAGNRGFDPITITMNILALQLCYYTTLSLCIMVVDFLFGMRSHMGQIFNPASFDLAESYSFVTILANGINIIFVVAQQAFIVEKANRCLDFTLTIFTMHLIMVWLYTGKFPWSFEWWMVHAALVSI